MNDPPAALQPYGMLQETPSKYCNGRVNPIVISRLSRNLRTVFLDRDGVLNEKAPEGNYVACWEQFRVLPGVPQAIARLNRAGLRVIVVTNQRGIARGLYTLEDVEAIHARFAELLAQHGAHVDAFLICPHEAGECNCRKPLTGLFDQAIARFPDVTAAESVMIGDSAADMEFGRRLGMATIWIAPHPGHRKTGANTAEMTADLWFASIPEAVGALLSH
jgi:D-glycero-D-manno-heptose 1,7-bisphosphate phosphatase